MKKVCHWILFVILTFFAIAQLPTGIGRNFLILAVLAAPFQAIQNKIDWLFSQCSPRLFLALLCLLCITWQPMEEFEEEGKQMGRFLYGIFEILNLR